MEIQENTETIEKQPENQEKNDEIPVENQENLQQPQEKPIEPQENLQENQEKPSENQENPPENVQENQEKPTEPPIKPSSKPKFEDHLWNKYEQLHEKFKKRYDIIYKLLTILTKLQDASRDYSKTMKSILNKNFSLSTTEEPDLSNLLESIKTDVTLQSTLYQQLSENIKSKMIDPLKKLIDQSFTIEKDKYNEFKKSLKNYQNSINANIKAESAFRIAAKTAEKAIYEAEKMNLSLAGNEEKEKSNKFANQSIVNAKNLEKIYMEKNEIANKNRVDSNEKQRNLLIEYQVIDQELDKQLKETVTMYIANFKLSTTNLDNDINAISEEFRNLHIEENEDKFVLDNASSERPEQDILFLPYDPLIFKNKDENPEIVFLVINKLKQNLFNILPEYDIDKERELNKIRKISQNVFKTNIQFKSEEKQELINVLKDHDKRKLFISTLNNQRTVGKFARTIKLLEDLHEIIEQILTISEQENDYESARNCIILSQTFYVELEGKKKYLFEYIANNKWLTSIDFWYKIIEKMIEENIEMNESSNKEIIMKETEDGRKVRISNIAFSQVLPYTNNMLDFKVEKDKIVELVKFFCDKYSISQEYMEAILNNVESRQ